MGNSFIVLGNGGGGTSMLRGLLNNHPDCICMYEMWLKGKNFDENKKYWQDLMDRMNGFAFGIKIPIEQFTSYKWTCEQLSRLFEVFNKVIWIQRRYSKYEKRASKRAFYKREWKFAQKVYWVMREEKPQSVLLLSFEEILSRPQSELRRICDFLGVDYSDDSIEFMLKGLTDTGHPDYNYGELRMDKI